MQKWIVYILVCFYLGSILRPVFPLVEYAINQNYISKVLCINKDNKALNCNGKCYLMKRISQEEKKESNPKASNVKLEFHFLSSTCFDFHQEETFATDCLYFYENNYFHLINKGIFKPPRTC